MANSIRMNAAPEVVTFGETMGLLMPNGFKGLEASHLLEKSFGGAESNVAIGIQRLGHQAGWFGRVGSDPLGRSILKSIRGEGVDVSRASVSESAPTGLMLREQVLQETSVYYYRTHSAASELGVEHIENVASYLAQAKILHVTGITPALSASCRQAVLKAIEIAKSHGVKVSFDPNLRLKLWTAQEARAVLLEMAESADYFLPGMEELQLLYGTGDWAELQERLRRLSAVSIVKGEEETTVVNGEECYSVPYYPVKEVIDPIGAGDAFCAGFLTGILKNEGLREAVELGNLCGSIVVQSWGDWEAFPDGPQVERILQNKQQVQR